MASYLRPRRGRKATAESQNIVLKKGEVFFECPDAGVGKGTGRIKVGDGITTYSQLPYFLNTSSFVSNVAETTIQFVENTSSSNEALLNTIASGAKVNVIIGAIKKMLRNLDSSVSTINAGLNETITGLSISGKTITYTKKSGTTGTLTTQDTVYTHPTSSGNKHIPSGGSAGQILRWSSDGTAVWGNDGDTKYSVMTGATGSSAGTAGLVPAPAAGKQTSFLRGDGTWVVPTNTTYNNMTGATSVANGAAGLVPAPAAGKQTSFLRGDGTWVVPTGTTYNVATSASNGLMHYEDKKKLDGIAYNANNYTHPTSSGNKHIPSGGSTGQILKWSSDGTAVWGNNTGTFTGATSSVTGKAGLVPAPAKGDQVDFLRGDGNWVGLYWGNWEDENKDSTVIPMAAAAGYALKQYSDQINLKASEIATNLNNNTYKFMKNGYLGGLIDYKIGTVPAGNKEGDTISKTLTFANKYRLDNAYSITITYGYATQIQACVTVPFEIFNGGGHEILLKDNIISNSSISVAYVSNNQIQIKYTATNDPMLSEFRINVYCKYVGAYYDIVQGGIASDGGKY